MTSIDPRRPIVVFLDRDAADQMRDIRGKIQQRRRLLNDSAEVVIAQVPGGRKDVAECSQQEAWQGVAAALEWSMPELLRSMKKA